MNNVLLSTGQRNKCLRQRCLDIAKKIGKVNVYYGENSCEVVNVVKHLDGERIRK